MHIGVPERETAVQVRNYLARGCRHCLHAVPEDRRHDPTDTTWIGRDRFVLSCATLSLTLYIQLYLGGFGLEPSDITALRTWKSRTPGDAEFRHTPGVEITTGPLGQGMASAVGMVMASRRERGLFDPEPALDESPFDHFIYRAVAHEDPQ